MKRLLFFSLLFLCSLYSWGQTPVSLPATPPYTQDFNTTPGAAIIGNSYSYPIGWASYNGIVIDNTMTGGDAGSTAGANYNYDSRVGILGSGSNFLPGSIVLAIESTSGLSDLRISYEVIKIREQGRSNTFNLQISTISPTSDFIDANVALGNYTSGSSANGAITPFNNVQIIGSGGQEGPIYIRWQYDDDIGSGLRDGLALDNVSITWTPEPPDIFFSFNNAGNNNISRGSENNLLFEALIQVTSGSAILRSAEFDTQGSYTSLDIQSNGFKLWASTDATFDPTMDTQLGAVSSTTGSGETLTFGSLSQFIPENGTVYLFVTADIASGASLGNTVGIANTTEADFTFDTPNTKNAASGSSTPHTIVGLETGVIANNSVCVSPTEGNPITVPFTYQPIGTYNSATFTAQLSDASGSFVSPVDIGSVSSEASGSQTINATIPAGSATSPNYRIRVVSIAPITNGSPSPTNIDVTLLTNSIAPTATQNNVAFQNGEDLTVTEVGGGVQTRRWKYSTVSGGPYNNFMGPDVSQTPYFETSGTYYIVCETEFECGKAVISNEVQVNVAPFQGTRLFPGDLVMVGWDSQVGGGGATDEILLTNLVPLSNGTRFQVVNATFENGEAASTRTYQWQSPRILEFTYNGTSDLPVGGIISFRIGSAGNDNPTNIEINGTTTTDISGTRLNPGGVGDGMNISASSPDQIFITQGSFSASSPSDFDGYILFGMSNGNDWVPITDPVLPSTRISRAHPNILCLNTEHPTLRGAAYYNPSALHNTEKRAILQSVTNMSNWTEVATASATSGNDIPTARYTTNFSITSTTTNVEPSAIEWIGNASPDPNNGDNWFLCNNWENLYVPDRRNDAILTTSVSVLPSSDRVRASIINSPSTDFRDEYEGIAEVRNITVLESQLAITRERASKLTVYEDLIIDNNGSIDMTDVSAFVADGTINIRGNWYNRIGESAFLEGESLVVFEGGDQQLIRTNGGVERFFDVTLNNSRGLILENDMFIVNEGGVSTRLGGRLVFQSGNIFSQLSYPDTYSVTFDRNGTYEGASENRHIRAASRRISNTVEDFIFPIGKNGIYRPAIIHTQSAGANTTFFAEYFDEGFGTYQPLIPPLVVVSELEYWTINREAGTADAEITLSYGQESSVGDPFDPANLVIAHWTDEIASVAGNEWVNRGRSFLGSGFLSGAMHGGAESTIVGGGGPSTLEGRLRSGQVFNATTGFGDVTFGSLNNDRILPVTWLSFDARYQKERSSVQLDWATASEQNNSHFSVERSENGLDFIEIGTVLSRGNSQNNTQAYQFEDLEPIIGQCYYRIKQTDFDGSTSYTGIKSISIDIPQGISVFGKDNALWINANLEEGTNSTISVFSVDGRLVGTCDMDIEAGSTRKRLPLTLPKALYVYKLEMKNKTEFVSGKVLMR